jgi:RimJ/RimL family protein N-acetyltransferase
MRHWLLLIQVIVIIRRMIETERLILRLPVSEDLDESFAMHADAAMVKYIGGRPAAREETWTKLLRNIGHWKVFGYGIFTLRDKEDGRFVGEAGLAHFARGLGEAFDPFPEAAWILAPHAHGRGYATEAVRAAHDWMTATHRPAKTVCIIHPDNTASLRIAEKLGYGRTGETQYRGASPIMFERSC